jgi:hypothetical protein
VPDRAALRAAVLAAAREFNRGRYFEAHEVLEEALEDVPDDRWDLFLGLIQIAVGYHKLSQGMHGGAARMLQMGMEKLPAPETPGAYVDLALLRRRVRSDLDLLRTRRFDADAFARDPPRLRPLR